MVEPKLTVLTADVLAKVGYDSPPAVVPSPRARPASGRTKRDRMPRVLREARRHMLYHWF
jgi:hypothetical protein